MNVDRVQGAAWILVGAAIIAASWTMDRLEASGAKLHSAPGLVPGLLGLVILVLGVMQALRRRSNAANLSLHKGWGSTAAVMVLCLGYAVGLVGRAPFWLATFAFVTAFIAVFEYPARRRLLMAPVYGAATSIVVTVLFEQLFLVRLP